MDRAGALHRRQNHRSKTKKSCAARLAPTLAGLRNGVATEEFRIMVSQSECGVESTRQKWARLRNLGLFVRGVNLEGTSVK